MWTRKFFDQWEWYHRPVSPMEESLLLPKHINQSLSLISKKLGIRFPSPAWKVISGYLYMTGKYSSVLFQPGIILLPFKFWKELPVAGRRWTRQVLPAYQKEIDKVKIMDLEKFRQDKLIEILEKISELESKLMAESVYVVLYAISSEVMVKIAYGLLVRDAEKINYHELLIGFPDAGLEADAQLWKISRLTGKNRQSKIQDWICRFGHRIQDKDILYPTLGENLEMIDNLIRIYRSATDPKQRIEAAVTRRLAREKLAAENLHSIPGVKVVFGKIKQIAQDYAKIRNSRPFYYQGNHQIRRILLALAKRISWLEDINDVFFLRLEELSPATGNVSAEILKRQVADRKSLYNERLNSPPRLFTSL